MTRSLWMAAAALIAAGCKGPAEEGPPVSHVIQASSPVEVWLAIGDEVRVDSILRLAFSGVPADSRCPTSVVCAWAGDGAVALQHRLGMGPSYPDTLHTTLDPQHVQFAGYVITLLNLGPDPHDTNPIPADEYAARLRIERSQP
jgi:hypothetical protein